MNREENCVLSLAEIKGKKKVHQVTVNVNLVIKRTLKSQPSLSSLLLCRSCLPEVGQPYMRSGAVSKRDTFDVNRHPENSGFSCQLHMSFVLATELNDYY